MKITDNAKIFGFFLLIITGLFCSLTKTHLIIIFILLFISKKHILKWIFKYKFDLLVLFIILLFFKTSLLNFLKFTEILIYILLIRKSTNFLNFEKGLGNFLSIFQKFININIISISMSLTIKYFYNTLLNLKKKDIFKIKSIDYNDLSFFNKILYYIILIPTALTKSIRNTDKIIDNYNINQYDINRKNNIDFNFMSIIFILAHFIIMILLFKSEVLLWDI